MLGWFPQGALAQSAAELLIFLRLYKAAASFFNRFIRGNVKPIPERKEWHHEASVDLGLRAVVSWAALNPVLKTVA